MLCDAFQIVKSALEVPSCVTDNLLFPSALVHCIAPSLFSFSPESSSSCRPPNTRFDNQPKLSKSNDRETPSSLDSSCVQKPPRFLRLYFVQLKSQTPLTFFSSQLSSPFSSIGLSVHSISIRSCSRSSGHSILSSFT